MLVCYNGSLPLCRAQVEELREAVAELLAAYEATLVRQQPVDVAAAAYLPAPLRRQRHLIDQLKHLLMAHGPTELILKQVCKATF